MGFADSFKHAWNAFFNRDPTGEYREHGMAHYARPDRVRFTRGNDKSIVAAFLNKIALDAAAIDIEHVDTDEEGRYANTRKSGLNDCLSVEANIDQTGRAFRQDIYVSMFDEGSVAIVPVETTLDPKNTSSYDITSMRTGKITEWRPTTVKVEVYNERTGRKEEVILPKKIVGIVENPFYTVMNENNSVLKRLVRKLNILDAIDEQSGSGKLDLIIQLPYTIKSPARREQADKRRTDIESQLSNSKYGIAYTDSTERVTQLNRPVENNLMKQIEYLTSMLYSQLGITQSILDGTANEETMTNYYARTIDPVVTAVVDEMKRKFLTKTARSQGQTIMAFRDPFKLVSATKFVEIADVLCRNEIGSSNEMRQVIGWKPSKDPKADQLVNSNMPQPNGGPYIAPEEVEDPTESQTVDPASVLNTPVSEL